MTDINPELSGEQRNKKRKLAFWRYFALTLAGFAAVGFFAGYFQKMFERGDVPVAVPLTIAAAALLALIWFTWDFFQRIDELDLMDNLWAHLIGQYIAVFGFICWYFLGELGLTGYPTAIATIAMLAGGTFLAYGLRKLGWR